MKTNKLKCLAAVSSLALFSSAYPALSQSTTDPGSSQSGAQQSQSKSLSDSSQPSSVQNAPSTLPSSSSSSRMQSSQGARIDEPAGADNSGKNWGWIGLFGLAGLFGLKRTHDVRDENYRGARA